MISLLLVSLALFVNSLFAAEASLPDASEKHLLYVASPGIRNYLEYGGHGLLVYDMDHDHRFLKRIPTGGLNEKGQPNNVKGVCASPALGRIYVSNLQTLLCLDLMTEKVLWERAYPGGCDRMAISPDGLTIYLPTLERDDWHVLKAENGEIITKISPKSGSHNTIYSLQGDRAYLAGLRSPFLTVAETKTHTVQSQVGPFTASIRPFTVNRSGTLCFLNINELLGFEVGDLVTGKKLHRVEVSGFAMGPTKRHGCPSHGVGLTPDETELWLTDAANSHLHIFDATVMPPRQIASVALRDQPGWVTFSLDGKLAYPSTGEIIDVKSRKIVGILKDEHGKEIQSEKMVEIVFKGGKPVRAGDQFGLGRKESK